MASMATVCCARPRGHKARARCAHCAIRTGRSEPAREVTAGHRSCEPSRWDPGAPAFRSRPATTAGPHQCAHSRRSGRPGERPRWSSKARENGHSAGPEGAVGCLRLALALQDDGPAWEKSGKPAAVASGCWWGTGPLGPPSGPAGPATPGLRRPRGAGAVGGLNQRVAGGQLILYVKRWHGRSRCRRRVRVWGCSCSRPSGVCR